MVGLGNILEPDSDRPKGPDLRVKVQVPRSALGREGGALVGVPAEIEHDGRPIARAASPHDERGKVRLHLPAEIPEGAVLRLRGQGGRREGGVPGDLFVEVEVVPDPRPWWILVLVAALAAGVAVATLVEI